MTDTEGSRPPLRVLFDAFWWAAGPISNRELMREIIFTWQRLHPEDELFVAVKAQDAALASSELGPGVGVVSTRLKPQGVSAILELPFLARRLSVDVTVTHNFSPLFGRSAVFIQDFLFLSNPEWFTRKERLYFALMPLSVRFATTVFASTSAEGRRLARFGRLRSTPVVVGLGLNRSLESATPTPPDWAGATPRFVLSVGRLNARKNLAFTISSALASGAISPALPLLIVGEASGRGTGLSDEAEAAMQSGAVRFVGRVTDAELRWMYAHTDLFLFFSLDEGFGMPNLEALAFGAPLLVSDIPVFREILGENGTFVDPTDVDAAATLISSLLASDRATPTGQQVLAQYTWEHTVENMRTEIVQNTPAKPKSEVNR